jgi:hypothetical protein
MPRVPTRKRTDTGIAPLREAPIPERPAAPTGKAGEAITKFAGDLYDVAKGEADRVKASGFRSELNNWEAETVHGPTGYTQMQGENALQIPDLLEADLKTRGDELRKTANGATQNRLLDEMLVSRQESIGRWASSHIDTQIGRMQDKAYAADLEGIRNLALTSGDIETALISNHASIVGYMTAKGLSGRADIMNAEFRRQDTILVTAYAQSLISDNRAEEALTLLKKTTGIDVAVKNKLIEQAEKETNNEKARQASDAVMSKYVSEAATDTLLKSDVVKSVKAMKLSPEVEKLALALTSTAVATHDSDKKKIEAENEAAVTDSIIQGVPIEDIMRTPEWKIVPATKQRALIKYAKTVGSGKDVPVTPENFNQFQTLMNPDELVHHSEAELRALAPYLGRAQVTQLLKAKRALDKFDTSKVGLTKREFDRLADLAGLDPYNPQKSADDKIELGAFYGQVISVLSEEQETVGRKLRQNEIYDIMQREMDNKITSDAGWFSRAEETPLFRTTEEQRANVVIPPEERLLVRDALRAQGLPVTNDAVRELFLRTRANAR